MTKWLFLILLLWSSIAQADVLINDRRIDWSKAGYPGEIPDPTLVLNVANYGAAGNGSTDCTSAVNQTISALGGNPGVVYFPAGTYKLTATISLPSGAVLRGAGSTQTTLAFNLNNAAVNGISISGSAGAFVALSSGYTKGSTQLVPGNVTGFSAGDWVEIQQTNGSWDTNPADWATNAVGQLVQLKAVEGGTLVLETPLHTGYDASLSPQLRKVIPKTAVGVESLKIERTDNPTGAGYNIGINLAVGAFVRGVESNKSAGSHIMIGQSAKVEVSGNYLHHAFGYDGSGTRGYGITLNNHATFCLVKNNIFEHLRHAMMAKMGANGNVVAYNYSRDVYRDGSGEVVFGQGADFGGDISLHGHYSYANLFEGNIVQTIMIDHTWGPSGPYNTFFRNRTEHYGIVITNNTTNSSWTSPYQNFIGNEVNPASNMAFSLVYGGIEYALKGSGHFEYGNRVDTDIVPSGTTALTETSYYLPGGRDTCQLAAHWPPLGLPNNLNQYTNRAKDRYSAGGIKTYLDLRAKAGNDIVVQWGQGGRLHGAAQGGSGSLQIAWTPTTGLDNPSILEPWANPDNTTEYRLRLTDSLGCSVEDQVLVTVTGTVADPVITPQAGIYYAVQTLSLSCTTPQAVIRYTVDGREPDTNSDLYQHSFSVSQDTTVKAKAFREGWTASQTVTASYDIEDIDECLSGQDACDEHAVCQNTWLAYTCACLEGFDGDGFHCSPHCGDGQIVDGEDCEDGNTENGDCCSSRCTWEGQGSPCGSSASGECDKPDTCNGVGECLEHHEIQGTACGQAEGACRYGDACNAEGQCLSGGNKDSSTECNDANTCTENDHCSEGHCVGDDITCKDTNLCTSDRCDVEQGCVFSDLPDWTDCSEVPTSEMACFVSRCEVVPETDRCGTATLLSPGDTVQGSLDGHHAFKEIPESCTGTKSLRIPDAFFLLEVQSGKHYEVILSPMSEGFALAFALWEDCEAAQCLLFENSDKLEGELQAQFHADRENLVLQIVANEALNGTEFTVSLIELAQPDGDEEQAEGEGQSEGDVTDSEIEPDTDATPDGDTDSDTDGDLDEADLALDPDLEPEQGSEIESDVAEDDNVGDGDSVTDGDGIPDGDVSTETDVPDETEPAADGDPILDGDGSPDGDGNVDVEADTELEADADAAEFNQEPERPGTHSDDCQSVREGNLLAFLAALVAMWRRRKKDAESAR